MVSSSPLSLLGHGHHTRTMRCTTTISSSPTPLPLLLLLLLAASQMSEDQPNPLRAGIHASIKAINRGLGSLETSVVSTNQEFTSRVVPLGLRIVAIRKEIPSIASRFPGLIPVTAAAVGAAPVLMTRGKGAGLLAGVIIGAAAQGAILGLTLMDDSKK
jgi:hypothetical protein